LMRAGAFRRVIARDQQSTQWRLTVHADTSVREIAEL